MSATEQKIFDALAPVAQGEGAELVEVRLTEISKKLSVSLFIDIADRPVTLEDCERVHRKVDGVLDELDPTRGAPYTLNVSSLGLDRPIKSDGDFRRNLGKEVTAKFFVPVDGSREREGVLTAFDAETFTLEAGGAQVTYDRKKACKIQLKLDF